MRLIKNYLSIWGIILKNLINKMRKEILEINDKKYPINIFVEERDNTTASIGKNSINIRVLHSISREEMFKQIMKMKLWVRQKIIEKPEKFKLIEYKNYKDGDEIKIGNELYRLNISYKDKESSSARIFKNAIILKIASNMSDEKRNKHISTLISRCVARKRLLELQKRIEDLNKKHFNQKFNKIFFKYNKSNWGSCSINGNINISTRLLFAPDDVLDYICIHELSHLIEHNHSNNFWNLVEKAMPDYKQKEKWLKENGGLCTF